MRFFILCSVVLMGFWGESQHRLVIQNVRLFDGVKVEEKVSIEIVQGHFQRIGARPLETSDSTRTIDGTGKTILPGLINAHVHVWSKSQLKLALRAGVFAVLDMHSPENLIGKLREPGLTYKYAAYYSAGYAATAKGGHGTQYGYEVPYIGPEMTPEAFVRDRKTNHSDYVKIIYEPVRRTLSLDQIERIIRESHKQDLMAVAHISNLRNALEIAPLGIDALVHVWDDEVISRQQVRALKQSGLFIVPTLAVHEQVKKYYTENGIKNKMLDLSDLCENVRRLHKARVPILAGTDPPNLGINYGSSIYRELELLAQSGLSDLEALKAATSNPATYFSLENLGFIKEGYRANFILIDGDPTTNVSDIRKLDSVWIDGQKINQ